MQRHVEPWKWLPYIESGMVQGDSAVGKHVRPCSHRQTNALLHAAENLNIEMKYDPLLKEQSVLG